jgi:hypothetical protein
MSDGWQLRLRWVWITRASSNSWPSPGGLTVWLHVGGRKPLAHLPRWRRRLLHLPGIRARLWPRPFRKQAYTDVRWQQLLRERCTSEHVGCLGPQVAANQGGCRMATWGDL